MTENYKLESFEQFLQSGRFADVTLVSKEGKKYPAHRVFLCRKSEYFRNMFAGQEKARNYRIQLPFHDPRSVFESILRYMYTAYVSVTDKTVVALSMAAQQYRIRDITVMCRRHLEGSMGPRTVFAYLEEGVRLGFLPIINMCIDVIAHDVDRYRNSLQKIPVDIITKLLSMVRGENNLNAGAVYETVFSYMDATRDSSFEEEKKTVLNNVNLSVMPCEQIASNERFLPQDMCASGYKERLRIFEKVFLSLDSMPSSECDRSSAMNAIISNFRGTRSFNELLLKTCRNGNADAVEMLVKCGADMTARQGRSQDGMLHVASDAGRADIVRYLTRELGIDINEPNKYHETPLHKAANTGAEEVTSYLLDSGAIRMIADDAGETPLHKAASFRDTDAVVPMLLEQADAELVDSRAEDGQTALHRASYWGKLRYVGALLDLGARVGVRDEGGDTALHKTFNALEINMNDREELFKLLMNSKGEIESENKVNETPLHNVMRYAPPAVAMRLFALVEDLETFPYNHTLLHAASESGALLKDDLKGALSIVNLLINIGFDINARDPQSQTPLHRAVGQDRSRAHATVSPDIKYKLVRHLIENGAEVSTVDVNGRRPLHLCDERSVAELLISHGADKEVLNDFGETPLHEAVDGECVDLVEYYVEQGVTSDVRSGKGETPLDVAHRIEAWDIVEILEGEEQ
eukprot:gb/GECH01000237.1/.p1 GENE.gb/GECH01000237.1/~~gb/GECH01000237.1/.p1  ORF type:complete len:693 (+),score=110.34 gb/GECH01000237.1/:1-2079(+)